MVLRTFDIRSVLTLLTLIFLSSVAFGGEEDAAAPLLPNLYTPDPDFNLLEGESYDPYSGSISLNNHVSYPGNGMPIDVSFDPVGVSGHPYLIMPQGDASTCSHVFRAYRQIGESALYMQFGAESIAFSWTEGSASSLPPYRFPTEAVFVNTTSNWYMTCDSNDYFVAHSPDGLKYSFGGVFATFQAFHLPLREVRDGKDNWIKYSQYHTARNPSVIETSDGRWIGITRSRENAVPGFDAALSTIKSNGAPNPINLEFQYDSSQHIRTITREDGKSWEYHYKVDYLYFNKVYLIKKIVFPDGAVTEYEHEKIKGDISASPGPAFAPLEQRESFAVTKRTLRTKYGEKVWHFGRAISLDGSLYARFAVGPSNSQFWVYSSGRKKSTVVPNSYAGKKMLEHFIAEKTFGSVDQFIDDIGFFSGGRVISGPSHRIENRYEFKKNTLSDPTTAEAGLRIRYVTHTINGIRKSTKRYSYLLDGYNYPSEELSVSTSGTSKVIKTEYHPATRIDGLNRVLVSNGIWMPNKVVSSETRVGDGVSQTTWDIDKNTGLANSIEIDGRKTVYEYDDYGNVSSEKDPEEKTTYYGPYELGIATLEKNRVGQFVRRVVNTDGTVKFESVLGNTSVGTTFLYDTSRRVKEIRYATSDAYPTYINWSYSNGETRRNETRGAQYLKSSVFNEFGLIKSESTQITRSGAANGRETI